MCYVLGVLDWPVQPDDMQRLEQYRVRDVQQANHRQRWKLLFHQHWIQWTSLMQWILPEPVLSSRHQMHTMRAKQLVQVG
jgi:hypothetical protein